MASRTIGRVRRAGLIAVCMLWAGCSGRPAPANDAGIDAGECTPANLEGGFRECGGTLDRITAEACTSAPEVPRCTGGSSLCATDGDCTAQANGRCYDWWDSCYCVYECNSDEECGTGSACLCGAADPRGLGFNRCLPAACRTGADCESGECALSVDCCGIPTGLYCRTPRDTCRNKLDCGDIDGDDCAYDLEKGRWRCVAECSCE